MANSEEHIAIKALREGNEKGLEWLFERFKVPIFHFCLKMLKEQSLAEEATTDVFIKIWKKREIIDPSRSISPFLYKIAKDTTYSYLRKVASQNRLKEKFWKNYKAIDHKDGEWFFMQKEHEEKIERIIDALPPQRKTIFRMRYFGGKDNASIAAELKVSIHTVKSQLVKARSFVREQLKCTQVSNLYWLIGLLFLMG